MAQEGKTFLCFFYHLNPNLIQWQILQTIKSKPFGTKQINNVNPDEWRKDACDAWINRNQYGQESIYGWEIDHILPIAKNGTDHTDNLRAFHWRNNRSKGDDFPCYVSQITSDSNKNIEKQMERTVNAKTIEFLGQLYPANPLVAR